MVAKKLHHTPKPQIQSVKPRRRRLGIRTIPCVFGEERRIKRFWYVFWKRGERCRKRLSRAQEPGRPLFFWFEGCLGPFIALAHFSRRTVATFKRPWIGLILTPLKIFWLFVSKRYGSWKSNGRIKSYGSQKLVMHQSVCYLDFCDILAFLTPISTHK